MVDKYPSDWKTKNIKKTTYLKGRIGWQGLKASEFTTEGAYLVTGTDFNSGRINWDTCYHISMKRYEEAPSIHLKNGDLLITKDGTIGKTAVVKNCPENAILNSGILLIRSYSNEYNHLFMYYILNSELFHKFLKDTQAGSTINHLYQRVFETFNFPAPEFKEQSKIAEILSKVDEAIEHTENIIAKQERIKEGLTQDLFTKGIDEKGNIRNENTCKFKDSFLGRIPKEWDIKKIIKLAKISTGNKDTQNRVEWGKYPFFVRSQKIERINGYSYDGEAILTAGDGVGTGKVYHYINGKFDFHQRVYMLYAFDKKISPKYLFEYFKRNFLKEVAKFSAKTTVDSVRRHMITEMLVPIPEKEEQKQISKIFTEIGNSMQNHNLELIKLNNLKAGLMQDLLTGNVRVNHLIGATA